MKHDLPVRISLLLIALENDSAALDDSQAIMAPAASALFTVAIGVAASKRVFKSESGYCWRSS